MTGRTAPSTALKVRALDNMMEFANLINFQGGRKNFGSIHEELAEFVTKPQDNKAEGYSNRRLILMPRGHLKSTVCSVLYVLWRIYRNPGIRVLVGCNKLELSQTFIRALRMYLEDEELQANVWNSRPHIPGRLVPLMDKAGRKRRVQKEQEDETEAEDKKVIWNLQAIQVLRDREVKEPTVLATSVGTRATGQHYDLLILDDVVDFDNCSTQLKINKTFEWCQDMESVLDPPTLVSYGKYSEKLGDEVVVLGTRYDAADYYHYLLGNLEELEYKTFIKNIYKNGSDNADGYIWDKFDDKYFERLRKRTTPRRFASQYLNTILADEDMVLRFELVKFFKSTFVEVKENNTVEIKIADEPTNRVIKPWMVVDTAVSQSSTADNTVITVGGVDANRDVFVVDTKIGKFTPSQTIDLIFELAKKWNLHSVTVETNGVGGTLPYHIKERFKSERPLVVREIRSKGEKKARIESRLQPLFENGKLYFADWMATNQVIKDEVLYFPRDTAKDDFLDTLDMLCEVAYPTPRKASKAVTQHRTYNTKYGGVR